jgi:predicted PurR-regulated permease PerM
MNEERGITFSITTGTMIRALLLVSGVWALWYLRDIVTVVIVAVVIASAVEPIVQLLARIRIPRMIAVLSVFGAGVTFTLWGIWAFIPVLMKDVAMILKLVPQQFDLTTVLGASSSDILAVLDKNASLLEFLSARLVNSGVADTAAQFFGGFISLILTIVLAFYFSAQERGIENFLRLVTPAREAGYVVGLWRRAQQKIGLWFQGQLLLGLVVGVLAFFGLTLLGVQSAFFLASLIVIFELIPVLGPIMAAIPAIAIAHGGIEGVIPATGITAAAIVAGMYVVVQQIESHVVYPLVVRKIIGIPPVLVIISLVIGASLGGLVGILLAVPIMAVLMEFISDIAREKEIF